MAVWLITGATGFVGRYVLDAVKAGVQGLARSETRWSRWAVAARSVGRSDRSSRPT